jgi:hypothetical protein
VVRFAAGRRAVVRFAVLRRAVVRFAVVRRAVARFAVVRFAVRFAGVRFAVVRRAVVRFAAGRLAVVRRAVVRFAAGRRAVVRFVALRFAAGRRAVVRFAVVRRAALLRALRRAGGIWFLLLVDSRTIVWFLFHTSDCNARGVDEKVLCSSSSPKAAERVRRRTMTPIRGRRCRCARQVHAPVVSSRTESWLFAGRNRKRRIPGTPYGTSDCP